MINLLFLELAKITCLPTAGKSLEMTLIELIREI